MKARASRIGAGASRKTSVRRTSKAPASSRMKLFALANGQNSTRNRRNVRAGSNYRKHTQEDLFRRFKEKRTFDVYNVRHVT